MENLLLVLDDLDDAVRSLRMLWPQILSLFLALALFAATILVIMNWPWLTTGSLLVLALARSLSGLPALPALRTDP